MPDGSKAALNRWRLNMISKLGEEGFKEFYLDQLTKGKEFHKTLEKQLSGQAIPPGSISMSTNECLKSIDWVLRQLSEISVVESRVVHSKLGYRGVLDCVAKFRNKPVLIEWKRSDKPKPLLQSTYDAPIQLSAYVGAFNFDTNYNFQIEGGLVVVAYSNGANADIFHITLEQCNQYWKLWLARLKQYISKTAI
ncbi:hypothetical protein AAG570_008415 [Ranatra chinensis]|uniref:Mitochondrial genome maintenance exonuclease 1 n=1 Tax=Ranatra chinensis TaxID=642074 RepID=A0ABD0YRG1_9HEMI